VVDLRGKEDPPSKPDDLPEIVGRIWLEVRLDGGGRVERAVTEEEMRESTTLTPLSS